MRTIFYLTIAITLIVLTVVLCSTPAETHSNERTAIYNLSGMLFSLARQLNRIEDRLGECIVNKREER